MPRPKLFGTYTPPPVKKGDRVTCLYRDADCVVTGWHDGRIPWPRVRALESRGGSGLWVEDELARAVRTESSEALVYWFGVSSHAAWNWRCAFGVEGVTGTPGSAAAHLKVSRKATRAAQQHRASRAERKRVKGLNAVRWKGRTWTPEEVALLGTDTDRAIAARIGRSLNAVALMRHTLMIPPHETAKSHKRG